VRALERVDRPLTVPIVNDYWECAEFPHEFSAGLAGTGLNTLKVHPERRST
jgi:hypothetical protein